MQQIPQNTALTVKDLPEELLAELDEFISSISHIPYFKPEGAPKRGWKVFYGETLAAAWASAKDAAWVSSVAVEEDAAMNGAKDAAWVAASGAIRHAAIDARRDAAWIAAWDSARQAVWDAVGTIARNLASVSAGDAVLDAALMAQMIVTKDLDFKDKDKHAKHVSERMDAWKRGYGVAADVNGILYVYCVGRPPSVR